MTAPRGAAVTLESARGGKVGARLTVEGGGLVEIATGDARVDHLLELTARRAHIVDAVFEGLGEALRMACQTLAPGT